MGSIPGEGRMERMNCDVHGGCPDGMDSGGDVCSCVLLINRIIL